MTNPTIMNWANAAMIAATGMAQLAGARLPWWRKLLWWCLRPFRRSPKPPQSIVIAGIEPGQLFTGQQVRDLCDAINQHVGNGKIVLTATRRDDLGKAT